MYKNLVQSPVISIEVGKKSNNKYLKKFIELQRTPKIAFPTTDITLKSCGYLRSYERGRASNTRLWMKKRTPGLTGTSELDRGENVATNNQNSQPHIHTWQLSSRG